MQYDKTTQKHKHKESRHREMGPVRQCNPENCKNCSSKYAYDCAQLSVHNTAQNSSDNLPSYLQTTIRAPMLSIRGKVGPLVTEACVFDIVICA